MPLQATSGAASYDAFGGGVPFEPTYIEQIFQTWLYTGNGSTQTITNGIDLAGKGGLVWCKERANTIGVRHYLFDSARGLSQAIETDSVNSQTNRTTSVNAFNANGFSMGSAGTTNNNGTTYVSWTFREQPKFFDAVTWTGNGANRTIAHNLGSVPGCIIVKRTDSNGDWQVYHRSLGNTQYLILNGTASSAPSSTRWNDTTPTDTVFSLGTDATVNASGGTYVAYLYAHNAGGFGLTGTDNVISCGTFTTDGSGNASVTLGYEPQWVLNKTSSSADNWTIADNMRGFSVTNEQRLYANLSNAEAAATTFKPTATGYTVNGGEVSQTYIYIAIRRGPMKVPTTGTSVFNTILQTPQSAGTVRTVGFPADLMLGTYRSAAVPTLVNTRLIRYANNSGASQDTPSIRTQSTGAEANRYPLFYDVWNTTAKDGDYIFGSNGVNWMFGRAPGFFDVVCYTGDDGSNRALSHNLGAVPELAIFKRRNGSADWFVYATALPNVGGQINTTNWFVSSLSTAGTSPWTSSTIFIKSPGLDSQGANGSGDTYVAYLFASCPGVSKVGTYTGTGATQTINCGFTGGARFVLIKRTSTEAGDWYVWDSARGIVAGNDPYLLLNSTAAEVTSNDTIDTDSTGFVVNQVAATNVNVNAATYIFLAIA